MTSKLRLYPKDLRNGDVIARRTRHGFEEMTVAWVGEPYKGGGVNIRDIEGPTATEWMVEPTQANSKVTVIRRG